MPPGLRMEEAVEEGMQEAMQEAPEEDAAVRAVRRALAGTGGVLVLVACVALFAASVSPLGAVAEPGGGSTVQAGVGSTAQGSVGSLPSPDRPTAYLVTVGPGDAVWERFGHNLIWIHDPEGGTDEGYNYGMFSFEQEDFLIRFIRGYMRYWMEGFDVGSQLGLYVAQNRSIWIQELALDPAAVGELHAFLEWNERPANRFYRYDYYRDNCSTRVRDALDRVLGGRLAGWARERSTPASYRDHTLRQTAGLFWASVGMHFSLAPPADRPLSAWEAMFIPMEMQEHLRDFTVAPGAGGGGAGPVDDPGDEARAGGASAGEPPTDAGGPVPLVRSEWTYFESDRAPTPEETPRWVPSFLLTGLALAVLFAVLGVRGSGASARGSGGVPRTLFAVLSVAWLAVLGALGLLVVFAWGFTDHVFTHGSLNLFYANPLLLVLAVTVWPLLRGRPWAVAWAPRLALAVAGLTGLGLVVELLPMLEQANGEFVVLMVPVNLVLAWTICRFAQRRPRGETGGA